MKTRRRGVAPFATGMSTNKCQMLPPCGTNPAWPQALLGRPAIAGCSPMFPRCGTSDIRRPSSATRGQLSVVPWFCRCNSALCAFAPLRLCVKAFPIRVFRGQKSAELASIRVNPCNCDTCTCLQLIAASCSYLQLIAPNCTSCASCDNFIFS